MIIRPFLCLKKVNPSVANEIRASKAHSRGNHAAFALFRCNNPNIPITVGQRLPIASKTRKDDTLPPKMRLTDPDPICRPNKTHLDIIWRLWAQLPNCASIPSGLHFDIDTLIVEMFEKSENSWIFIGRGGYLDGGEDLRMEEYSWEILAAPGRDGSKTPGG